VFWEVRPYRRTARARAASSVSVSRIWPGRSLCSLARTSAATAVFKFVFECYWAAAAGSEQYVCVRACDYARACVGASLSDLTLTSSPQEQIVALAVVPPRSVPSQPAQRICAAKQQAPRRHAPADRRRARQLPRARPRLRRPRADLRTWACGARGMHAPSSACIFQNNWNLAVSR
jgi:hypothetical protein